MPDPWSITITPIPKSEDAIIRTSDGQEWTVKGLALFADGGEGHLFSYTWNSPAVAARGCVRTIVSAMSQGNEFVIAFYRCLFKHFTRATGGERKFVDGEELLRQWEAEEVYKSVQEDPKKFN